MRRSHLDAAETQRVVQRLPAVRVARFADVQLVALATHIDARARDTADHQALNTAPARCGCSGQ